MSKVPRKIDPDSFINTRGTSFWRGLPFGSINDIQIKRYPTQYILQTGEVVTEYFKIPYPHRWQWVKIHHTDASDDENSTALAWYVRHKEWSEPSSWFPLFGNSALAAASEWITAEGPAYKFPQEDMEYLITTNTTDGHKVFPAFCIQILSKKGKEFVTYPGWKRQVTRLT